MGHSLAVLHAAAKAGDAQLATSVFRVLGERDATFELHHYEMLIHTYISAGDIKTSFTVLCIMAVAGVPFNERSTRAISKQLESGRDAPQAALALLRELKDEGRRVPVAALNCVIEASIGLGDLRQAIEQYKQVRAVCDDKPNVATFNNLLRGCRAEGRKDLAMFLAAEMLEMRVAPNALTYDRLLLICLQAADYEDAFRYYGEMKQQGWTPNQGTFIAIIHRCCEAGDQRAWTMLSAMAAAGMDESKTKQWLVRNWNDGSAPQQQEQASAVMS